MFTILRSQNSSSTQDQAFPSGFCCQAQQFPSSLAFGVRRVDCLIGRHRFSRTVSVVSGTSALTTRRILRGLQGLVWLTHFSRRQMRGPSLADAVAIRVIFRQPRSGRVDQARGQA